MPVLPISRFFAEQLDAPLRNERWSWGAESVARRVLILRLWEHERDSDGSSFLIFKERLWDGRPGQSERRKHLYRMRDGHSALAVICEARDPAAENRKIKSYDPDRLFRLGEPFQRANGFWYAPVLGEVRLEEYLQAVSGYDSIEADLAEIATRPLGPTQRKALRDARIGQGRFREQLLEKWNKCCAVTGCSVQQAIRASHAKPWRMSTDSERLDPHNGLPLVATLDALFDDGLIGFKADGSMLVSSRLSAENREQLGLPCNLRRKPGIACAAYLAEHMTEIFR